MWSSGRRVLQDLLSLPAVRSFSLTAARNTVVVERWWQVPLSKVGSPPRLHPRRHRIYKFVEDTSHKPSQKMELILTQTVPKLGGRGDTVLVKKSVGRNRLLPEGLAVYPSPENKKIFAEELRLLREGKPEDRIQTRTGHLTVAVLRQSQLKINKVPCEDFQVTKEVVSRCFAKKLRIVVPVHAITLPFEPIKELGDYWCEVKVNGIDAVQVPMSVVPYEDMSANYRRQLKAQAAADAQEDAGEEDDSLEAVSDAAVETQAAEDSTSQGSTSAAEEMNTKTEQDAASPPSESPKKD
ncbi:39S ribosomal protein L9, mitochondrial [Mugil cephalus]|uniref:39S ribosomal protein L9, mitochondrial n=1 Tax=Mugil cephalus TaxID=48193 RepID=UPI001FB80122|nr:39S ribosomal protein L9, mitochondrial [Mugil cephalus]